MATINIVNSMKSQLNFRNPRNESWHLYHQQTPHSLYFTTLGHNHPPHVVIDHLLSPILAIVKLVVHKVTLPNATSLIG